MISPEDSTPISAADEQSIEQNGDISLVEEIGEIERQIIGQDVSTAFSFVNDYNDLTNLIDFFKKRKRMPRTTYWKN